MLQSLVFDNGRMGMLDIQPTILKGFWVQLEPLNESHKHELYSAAQDESIWTYNSSKAFGERFYRWFDKAIKCFQSQQHLPFRSGTTLVKNEPSPGEALRNKLLQEIWSAGGRIAWKKVSGHHRRSLVETHMFRLKSILGSTLRGRTFANQQTEVKIMANILNKMTHLGMPKSEKIFLVK